jgi:phospholipase/carboxylesterase
METTLTYELRRPKIIEDGKKYPTLFVMHGMGSNEQDMLQLVDGLEDSFFIFSIRGHLPQPPGYAFFTIEGFGKPHREVFDDTVHKLTNFIDDASMEFPIDISRLYILGFSQGAILGMTIGLTFNHKIKGVVALSGYIPQFVREEYSMKPREQLSVFISHGELDPIFPLTWGSANVEFFNQLGTDVTFKTYAVGHTVSAENHRDFRKWLLNDLGQ